MVIDLFEICVEIDKRAKQNQNITKIEKADKGQLIKNVGRHTEDNLNNKSNQIIKKDDDSKTNQKEIINDITEIDNLVSKESHEIKNKTELTQKSDSKHHSEHKIGSKMEINKTENMFRKSIAKK